MKPPTLPIIISAIDLLCSELSTENNLTHGNINWGSRNGAVELGLIDPFTGKRNL
jgi:hypothetical protein